MPRKSVPPPSALPKYSHSWSRATSHSGACAPRARIAFISEAKIRRCTFRLKYSGLTPIRSRASHSFRAHAS